MWYVVIDTLADQQVEILSPAWEEKAAITFIADLHPEFEQINMYLCTQDIDTIIAEA